MVPSRKPELESQNTLCNQEPGLESLEQSRHSCALTLLDLAESPEWLCCYLNVCHPSGAQGPSLFTTIILIRHTQDARTHKQGSYCLGHLT